MGKIKILSDQVVGKIAAGEVIERSVYVVKELVENSIDAAADYIKVLLEDSGFKKIAVFDNGEGMSSEDIKLSCLSHTTSKLDDENLHLIKTLGFRGEALSSIAAVSKLSLTSKNKQSKVGSKIKIEYGQVLDFSPSGSPVGTSVVVEDLFSNVPARKKFLKTDKTEYRYILDLLINFALSYPKIRFEFWHNKKLVFDLQKLDNILSRIKILLGEDIYINLIPFRFAESYLKITGFLTKPQIGIQTNQKQYIFVNGRKVSNSLISEAVKEGFGNLLAAHSYPVFILFIDLPYEQVDVNIHPKKDQVSFYNSDFIFSTVKNSVINTLSENNLTFYNLSFKNSDNQSTKLTQSYIGKFLKHQVLSSKDENIGKFDLSISPIQVHNLYLIFQTPKGIALIDQHAADERILYQKFLDSFNIQKKDSEQINLEKPILLDLSFIDREIMDENMEIFKKLGFVMEKFGEGSYKIETVPKIFQDRDIKYLILETLNDLASSGRVKDLDSKSKKMLSYLACRSAIKAGHKLSVAEIKNIVSKLSNLDDAYTCPHGRPLKIEISLDSLHKMFKRS